MAQVIDAPVRLFAVSGSAVAEGSPQVDGVWITQVRKVQVARGAARDDEFATLGRGPLLVAATTDLHANEIWQGSSVSGPKTGLSSSRSDQDSIDADLDGFQ